MESGLFVCDTVGLSVRSNREGIVFGRFRKEGIVVRLPGFEPGVTAWKSSPKIDFHRVRDGFIDYPCKIHPLISFNALKYPLSLIYNLKEVRDIMQCRDDFEFCNGCYFGCAIVASLPAKWKALYSKYIQGYLIGNL